MQKPDEPAPLYRFDIEVTRQDLRNFVRSHFIRTWFSRRALGLILVLYALLTTLDVILKPEEFGETPMEIVWHIGFSLFFFATLIVAFLFAMVLLVSHLMSSGEYLKRGAGMQRVELYADRLVISDDFERVEMLPARLYAIWQKGDDLYLQRQMNSAYILPARAFADKDERFDFLCRLREQLDPNDMPKLIGIS